MRKMASNYNQTYPKPLKMFYNEYKVNQYNLSPEFQRDEVWNPQEKSYLIDTIMKGLPIPTIYIATMSKKYGSQYIVVDGKQRLLSIIAFLEGKITLPNDFDKDDLGYSKMNCCTYAQLNEMQESDSRVQEFLNRFNDYTLPMVHINEPSDEIIKDIFDRLNRGRVLNTAERIHGIYVQTPIYQAIKEISNHSVLRSNMKLCREINSNRMIDVFFSANLFFSLLEEQIVEGSDKSILEKYKKHQYLEKKHIQDAIDRFNECMDFLDKLKINLFNMKINRPSHLYTLFSFSAYCTSHKVSYSQDIRNKIIEFYQKYNHKDFDCVAIKNYSNAILNSANSKSSRKTRALALAEYCGLYEKAPSFNFKSST